MCVSTLALGIVKLSNLSDPVVILVAHILLFGTKNDVKAEFYRAFNYIMGKIGRCASDKVTVSLIKAKCLPILLYGTEACRFSVRESTSIEYPMFKLFNTKSSEIL